MEVIVTKQRNVKDGQPMQQGNMQKEAILNETQTAGLQDHKAADAVTRYHTGRRVFQL